MSESARSRPGTESSQAPEEAPGRPSAFGYRNIRPLSRSDRRALKDKVALEQGRIMSRTGYQARMHQKYAPTHSSQLTSSEPGSVGFLSDADRFHSDTAGEEKLLRDRAVTRRRQVIETLRKRAMDREEQRWTTMEEAQTRDDDYWKRVQDLGMRDRKNKSSCPYDMLTLQYRDTLEGEQCRLGDEMVKYRAKLRTHNMVMQGDTRVDYDILTGGSRRDMPVPSAPPVPQQLEKYAAAKREQYQRNGMTDKLDEANQVFRPW